jgi:lipopolysaccharide biosynthesis glycosyltransferase
MINRMEERDRIHIALAFDQNFIVPFYVLLTSIFLNNKNNNLLFHTITEGIDQKQKDEITSFVQGNNAEITFYSVDVKLVQQFILSLDAPHVTSATYYRLYFPELVPTSVNKLLYLDIDIIVNGDLEKLFRTSINRFPVGAVADPKILRRPDLGIDEDGEYFNAGVLLLCLSEWRRQKISEKTIEFLNTSSEKIVLGDQDALNFVLVNNWYKLDKSYNITFYDIPTGLKRRDFGTYLSDKVIIHFTTQNKPWLHTCTNRLRYLYHYYFQQSPYAGTNVYTDEKVKKKYRYKILKRWLKEFFVDLGISR